MLTSLTVSKFHPLGKQLVDVCSDIPAFPPDDRAGQYEPCESLLQKGSPLEAWRSNALLHLYHKAHNITTIRRVLRRIPRKLNGALLVGQDDADMGWAMYRRSGLDRERILWTCFMALVLCMVPGLSWWMLRDDVQGGTGITSCLMVFVCFFVAATTTGKP